MKQITFFLDFISPYAYLAFKALPDALDGLSYAVRYQPVFLGGLLKHSKVLGPAEVPGKREWVYRQAQWLAHSQGLRLEMPAAHPFNPLGLLRLAVASDPQGLPNRMCVKPCFAMCGRAAKTLPTPSACKRLAPNLRPCGTPVVTRYETNSKPTPTAPSPRACLACPVMPSTARCFGAWTRCPCCATT